jgi:hypothetical protein
LRPGTRLHLSETFSRGMPLSSRGGPAG